MTAAEKLKKLEALRDTKIRLARLDFWEYCKLEDPKFYSDEHEYLRDLATLLQAFYEKRIRRPCDDPDDPHRGWRIYREDEIDPAMDVCRRLIVNMPPRHGKSRTIVLFESWMLGVSPKNRIICGSYNDDAAGDISRFVRDKISEETTNRWRVTYSDIFPETKLKAGDSSIGKWALEGEFFNYKATGRGGTSTGKGCNFLVVDDPIKNAEEAFNANTMAAARSWITDTLMSRMEGDDQMYLLVHTRWPGGDPTEDALSTDNASLYYHFSIPAHLGENNEALKGKMLNPKILDYRTFLERKADTDSTVFFANYQQEITAPMNALYKDLQTYDYLPRDAEGKLLYDSILAYADYADGGDDFTCVIYGIEYATKIYVTDVYYKCIDSQIAAFEVAMKLHANGTLEFSCESNSGGKRFAKDVEDILRSPEVGNKKCYVEWFHQSANKISRILAGAQGVRTRVLYPLDWKTKWPDYSKAMEGYLRVGRNRHDDAPDATTGIVEFADNRGVILR